MSEAGIAQAQAGPGAGTPDQPVKSSERLVSLDLIRGVAVLGILFANITAFGQSSSAYFWPPAIEGGATAADKAIWFFQLVLVDHKFRGLFSLLFGAGIYLFMERAWARGSGILLQARRLGWLLAFGLVHYFLIWTGDILAAYAVTGFWSLLLLGKTAQAQWRWGMGLYFAGLLFMVFAMAANIAAERVPAIQAQMSAEQRESIANAGANTRREAHEEMLVYRDRSYGQIVQHVASEKAGDLLGEVLIVPLTETLGLMLIGMALYRRGFFSGEWDPAKMRRWGWIGVIGGALMTVPFALWPLLTGFPFMITVASFNAFARLGQLPMVLGIAALLVVHAPTLAATSVGGRLVATGRTAFSNYLGTSILLLFVFHGWAIGLVGRLHRPELLLIVLGVWLLMLLWSKPWLARFRYGPLEWLWRCLTYGKVFPLRR